MMRLFSEIVAVVLTFLMILLWCGVAIVITAAPYVLVVLVIWWLFFA